MAMDMVRGLCPLSTLHLSRRFRPLVAIDLLSVDVLRRITTGYSTLRYLLLKGFLTTLLYYLRPIAGFAFCLRAL